VAVEQPLKELKTLKLLKTPIRRDTMIQKGKYMLTDEDKDSIFKEEPKKKEKHG
jgi:hypothetical protein